MSINQEESQEGLCAKGKAERPRLWTPIFVVILLMTFCIFMVGQGLNSGTTVFLATIGYSSALAGSLALVFSIAAAVARIAVGSLIDKGKCSLLVICGMLVLALGTCLMVVADGVPFFVTCRILQGIGFGTASTAAATAAADVLPRARLGEGIGYHGLGQALAMSLGPALALFLVGTTPATNMFVGIFLVGIVGIIFALNARYERKLSKLPPTCAYATRQAKKSDEEGACPSEGDNTAPDTEKRSAFLNILEPRALPGAIPCMIISPAFGFALFFMGLYGASLGFSNAALFYSVAAVSMIVVRMASKTFMDSLPAIAILSVACGCGFVAFLMMLEAPAFGEFFLLASGIPYGVSFGLTLPLSQSVVAKNTPSQRWGAANALYLLLYDIGIGSASALWGAVNDSMGFSTCIIGVLVFIAVGYVSAWILYPANQKRFGKKRQ